MIIRNPREQQFLWLQSYVTSDFVEPTQPKMTQTHSDRVVIITSPDQIVWEADGMVTSLKNLELQVRVADCGNIYAYDSVGEVIWVCHSGRQGSRKNIINTMLQNMKSLWSHTQDIVVRTWPCISWKNYQFWPEVKELFDEKYYTQDTSLRGGTTKQSISGLPRSVTLRSQWQHYYLDLPKLHRDQLLSSWILAEHLNQSDICTFDVLELPSYRRQWPDSGRITWSIMMKN